MTEQNKQERVISISATIDPVVNEEVLAKTIQRELKQNENIGNAVNFEDIEIYMSTFSG